MQSHLYGTHHITLHVDGIRHEYDRANGPAPLRLARTELGWPRRPLATRLRDSIGSMLVAAGELLSRSQPSGPETLAEPADTHAASRA